MKTASDVPMRKLWSWEDCSECGAEGYATRTQPRPVSDKYVCGDCETHAVGYRAGREAGLFEAHDILVAHRGGLSASKEASPAVLALESCRAKVSALITPAEDGE